MMMQTGMMMPGYAGRPHAGAPPAMPGMGMGFAPGQAPPPPQKLAPQDWFNGQQKVSQFDSKMRRIVYGQTPEPLTWAEQKQLALLTGGTLMMTGDAQGFIAEKGAIQQGNCGFFAVADESGKNFVIGGDAAPQGTGQSLIATTGYPTDWVRGDAWDFICFAVGPKANGWQAVMGMIPQAKKMVED